MHFFGAGAKASAARVRGGRSLAGAGGRVLWSYVKGGWRGTVHGELVHQAAWLKDGDRDLAVAILTDAQPSRLFAIHTGRGIADRLLERRPRPGGRASTRARR
jgi:hypothetical protein